MKLHVHAVVFIAVVCIAAGGRPLLDAAGGKSIGSLAPGAALDVVGQSGSSTHITLHGWFAAGSTSIVDTAPDKHIVALNGFTPAMPPAVRRKPSLLTAGSLRMR